MKCRSCKRPKRSIFKTFLLLIFFVSLYFSSVAQQPERAKLDIQMLLNTDSGRQNTADGVVVIFEKDFSPAIGDEDSYKFTNPDENLAIDCNGKLLSIEGRPTINGSDTIRLAMWQFRQKSYLLKLSGSGFSSVTKAVLLDNFLHKKTSINLTSSTLIPFDITTDSASIARDRFSVVFKTARIFSSSAAVKLAAMFAKHSFLTVSPNPVLGNAINFRLNNLKSGKYAVALFNSNGQLIQTGFINYDESSSLQTVVVDKRISKGIYNLQLSSGKQTITQHVLFR